MTKRLKISNITFGGKPLDFSLEIPCREELKPYLRSAAVAAAKLARCEYGGVTGYFLASEHIDALRQLPRMYPHSEVPQAVEAVEVYLRAQLRGLYLFIDPEVEWLPDTPENRERVRVAREAEVTE